LGILNGKNLFDISGKTALVTGAGAGLGEGYAHILAECGCNVVCAGATLAREQKTADAITAEGGSAAAIQADVRDTESVGRMVEEATRLFGKIDILVNNAGVEIAEEFLNVTPEHYDTIMGVNMRGVFFTAQSAALSMAQTGGGKIINIASLGSFIGLAESSVYCATKGGVVQFTKTLALELAKYNIQVNAIAPGYYVTPMTQPFYDDDSHRTWIEGRIPLGRWGTPLDLAGALIFLASAASDYVTGDVIAVDGGWLAG